MPQNDFLEISLDDLMQKIKLTVKSEYDLVVAIGRGGILPGYLAARYLDISLEIISLQFRDDQHQQIHQHPKLLNELNFSTAGKRILLCDDVANTGSTLNSAKIYLHNAASITTLVISGNGDISLTGAHDRCIKWPWQ